MEMTLVASAPVEAHPVRESARAQLSRRRILRFPFLDQLHNIANIPKPLFKAASHSRGHTDGAIHAGEIIPASVQRDHLDVVVDLLGMTVCQAGKAAFRFWPWGPLGIAFTCLPSTEKPKGNCRDGNYGYDPDQGGGFKPSATENPNGHE
jgi:hypothetical protein